ncbi:MAG: hypothetical protein GX150_02955 [Firmicutes bacterium]|nr:hypothetical protein [Bacillota bacterium]
MEWACGEKKFLRYKDPEVDKASLKKALKNGDAIPGAMLLTRHNLQIK